MQHVHLHALADAKTTSSLSRVARVYVAGIFRAMLKQKGCQATATEGHKSARLCHIKACRDLGEDMDAVM